jgi:hypothetical protein
VQSWPQVPQFVGSLFVSTHFELHRFGAVAEQVHDPELPQTMGALQSLLEQQFSLGMQVLLHGL